ncbi:MAG: hypothetical protein J6I50_08795 [Clostridia bacterium]|nr:hypothetical protein [Clostridia bacterium]
MTRWNVIRDGKAVAWDVAVGDIHTDDLEMAGFGCAHVVKYGMDETGFVLKHHPVFPTLRIRPNNTHASFQMELPRDALPVLYIDGTEAKETLRRAELDGTLYLICSTEEGCTVTHRCFPSKEKRLCFEVVTVTNTKSAPVALTQTAPPACIARVMGPMGVNLLEYHTDFVPVTLAAGECVTYTVQITGRTANEPVPSDSAVVAYHDRMEKIRALCTPMQLDTGNAVLDAMFRFAKLRAGESVFDTRFGYGKLHAPGGFSYYAATWCNDQVEYAGPYFAYTGDKVLIDAAMNAYRMYIPFMSDDYAPIPSSVIAEGIDYWNGAGDRGDAAMYLYGASRFALSCGVPEYAEELLPALRWCAEYCERKKNAAGVIASDSDELEGRFPSGDANLCTSSLAYAGLGYLAALEREIGDAAQASVYEERAEALSCAMEAYFGATVGGFNAYRYYDGCEKLRSWICMPLCVGMYTRADATVDALCSDALMRPDGFLTEEGSTTIWDRSTLYALRGIFAAGKTEVALHLLLRYAENRLLGERVPYAVEAYPEGGRRQLSGESALFCKVITEGILCLNPTGRYSFTVKPTLSFLCGIDHLYLRNICAHGISFDVLLDREGCRVIRSDGVVLAEGKMGELLYVNANTAPNKV